MPKGRQVFNIGIILAVLLGLLWAIKNERNAKGQEIIKEDTFIVASTGAVKPVSELPLLGAGQENVSKRGWNSKTLNTTDSNRFITEFHGKWINWLDADNVWKPIDPAFVDLGTHFGIE